MSLKLASFQSIISITKSKATKQKEHAEKEKDNKKRFEWEKLQTRERQQASPPR